MELEFRQKDLDLGQSRYDQIASYISVALNRFSKRINRVTIWLVDTNGSRGGVDKQCRIAVYLSKGKTIRAKNTNTNLIAAIYFAVDRAASAIRREIQRRRRFNRNLRSHGSDSM
jgi:putative sigma-54 modulation protein